MQFLKKNYEKILLGLVMCGLVVAVGFLPFLVTSEKAKLEEQRTSLISRPVRPLESPVTERYDLMLRQVKTPAALDLTSTNRLFNPLRWVKSPQQQVPWPQPPGRELDKLEIVRMTNLFLIVTLDTISTSDSGTRYGITVEKQAAAKANERGKRTAYAAKGDKKESFTLRDVKGPPENPTALILELPDADKPVSITKDKPFLRVDGYLADLKYSPENRSFPNRRANDPVNGKIVVSGEQYNIVAILENEVVLSAASNGKKYTIRYNAAP
jgi:hypothetical protein